MTFVEAKSMTHLGDRHIADIVVPQPHARMVHAVTLGRQSIDFDGSHDVKSGLTKPFGEPPTTREQIYRRRLAEAVTLGGRLGHRVHVFYGAKTTDIMIYDGPISDRLHGDRLDVLRQLPSSGERAGRVKTAQRRREVLTRPSVPGQSSAGATQTSALRVPKNPSRKCDRTRAVQRENRRLRQEPHQLLWRLRFSSPRTPDLRHEREVIQGAKQAAIPGPAERNLRHP